MQPTFWSLQIPPAPLFQRGGRETPPFVKGAARSAGGFADGSVSSALVRRYSYRSLLPWWEKPVLSLVEGDRMRGQQLDALLPFDTLTLALSHRGRGENTDVGRNKRSVSGLDDHAGNGLRPYPGLRPRKQL